MPYIYKYMKELLICPICENKFQTLNSHIHFKHKLTTEEFLIKYPGTKLVSDKIKIDVSNSCKKSGCGKWMKGYEFTDERKQEYSIKFSGEKNSFYGKKHSKKTKKRMSDNHADFSGDKNPLVKWLNKDPKNREEYSNKFKVLWNQENMKEILSKRNSKSVKKSMLNGNHNPYSKCKHGWFESKKFNNKFYYQSSYEEKFLNFCESSDKISSLQRLPFVIPYIDSVGKKRNYFADFLINRMMVIEIKPKSMLDYNNNKFKIEAGREYCTQNGFEYKLLMEEELKDLNKVL